ncbi:MAG: protein jag [Desulfobulbus sp.]
MGKGKDFYGKDIAEVIEQACKALGASREELDIEVLETGSAGIFGLCKKKAHIRVQRKETSLVADEVVPAKPVVAPAPVSEKMESTPAAQPEPPPPESESTTPPPKSADEIAPREVEESNEESLPGLGKAEKIGAAEKNEKADAAVAVEPPSEEGLAAIRADLHHLLTSMGLPSEVEVRFEENTVLCHIRGPHEEQIVGPEGRTLDSLQYLLRKMVANHLPDRIMLALNAGDFRERRAEELKARAVELAAMVKADGKTQSIPALNPSERRVVHMVLQEDKGVRSRSVGEGLFKKVLIYKPGKGRRSASKKRRGGQGGRSSGD